MQKYHSPWSRRLRAAASLLHQHGRATVGVLRGWPVYRPPIDHSLYAFDNAHLPTTYPQRARLVHRVSWWTEIAQPALIEFEHALALVGHVDLNDDYVEFKRSLPGRLARFFDWFSSGQHRLLGATSEAVQSAHTLAARYGHAIPSDRIEVLRWGGQLLRPCLPDVTGPLRVFHFGGKYPAFKGSHDVLAVARRLPRVSFHVVIDLEHPFAEALRLPNVTLHSVDNKRTYDQTLSLCHVLLHPIYGDGWGVILDALSQAMPMVIYDTFDKREALQPDETGSLVPVPARLSFYDGFMNNDYANFHEYNAFVVQHADPSRVDAMVSALSAYDADRQRLRAHSLATGRFYLARHDGRQRVARIRAIYDEMLQTTGATSAAR